MTVVQAAKPALTPAEAAAYWCPDPIKLTTAPDDLDGLAIFSAKQRDQYVSCANNEHAVSGLSTRVPGTPEPTSSSVKPST